MMGKRLIYSLRSITHNFIIPKLYNDYKSSKNLPKYIQNYSIHKSLNPKRIFIGRAEKTIFLLDF